MTRLDPAQVARNEHGIAACRAALDAVLARREQPADDEQPLTRSDELLAAARRRAAHDRLTAPTPRRHP
ncbi:hypothetical protein ACGFIG_09410 [Micromonospora sp. NPDC049048]|uniref:hypothetical protein n=1 Tax=Micromonospora sp. NPDC049048 TaxID=3364263 RepID=UPI0037130009